jgi:hypothetical protein
LKLELTSSETAEIELQAQPSSQQAYALRMIIINQSINQSINQPLNVIYKKINTFIRNFV